VALNRDAAATAEQPTSWSVLPCCRRQMSLLEQVRIYYTSRRDRTATYRCPLCRDLRGGLYVRTRLIAFQAIESLAAQRQLALAALEDNVIQPALQGPVTLEQPPPQLALEYLPQEPEPTPSPPEVMEQTPSSAPAEQVEVRQEAPQITIRLVSR
jgi:hypothetical protein